MRQSSASQTSGGSPFSARATLVCSNARLSISVALSNAAEIASALVASLPASLVEPMLEAEGLSEDVTRLGRE
jgi:hypothetical protein